MDYPKIIMQKDNWAQAFKVYFNKAEWLLSRFQEMKDVRNNIAHANIDLINEDEKEDWLKFCKKTMAIISR